MQHGAFNFELDGTQKQIDKLYKEKFSYFDSYLPYFAKFDEKGHFDRVATLKNCKVLCDNLPFREQAYHRAYNMQKDHLDAFFELDTYFYSSFYTNNLLPAAVHFTQRYQQWYGKDMDERYPKYGMLGFDTGYFFLKGLSCYGSELEKDIQQLDLVPIQTGFKFQRVNNWGGFINRKVFFVHFTKEYQLVKLDFD